jgi:competence protein ComGC
MGDLGLRRAYKRVPKNNIGYTLAELLTVLLIILVLTTFGVFVYHRAIAYAKGTVCQTNLRALESAVELYTMETDALPASLGRLKLEQIEKGYARAMRDGGWLKKLSFFLVKLDSSNEVYAQFLTPENLKTYGVSEGIFHCPADHNGGASYGINGNLVGRQWSKIGMDELVIGDSDHYVFTTPDQLTKRHRNKAFAINKGGVLLELHREGDGGTTESRSDETGDNDNVGSDNNDDNVIMICHKPGTRAEQTMIIPRTASSGHFGHGDTEGECSGSRGQEEDGSSGKGGG